MLVTFGNASVLGAGGQVLDRLDPTVTTMHIPDSYSFDPEVNVDEFKSHLYDAVVAGAGITQREDDEALLAVTHANGAWNSHSNAKPLWVDSDNAEFASVLAAFYGCPIGTPDDVEDTHFTLGGPPGIDTRGVSNLLVNSGRDHWAILEGGGQVGYAFTSGTATGTTAPINSGTPWTSNQWAGYVVYASVAGSFGVILSNTSSTLTIDRWYSVVTPGGTAGTTPAVGALMVIASGSAPAWFVGLSNSVTSPASGDTTLAGEILNGTPAGENNTFGSGASGLIRQIAPYAHSAGTNTYTLTPVYTVNSNETGILPQTIKAIGVFWSALTTASAMMFETTLSANATVSASGDQLTITETVTGS